MKIIAVMSPKGGIGKTTTSDSIAYMLGEEQEKRVLVLDGDPQGCLLYTSSFFCGAFAELDAAGFPFAAVNPFAMSDTPTVVLLYTALYLSLIHISTCAAHYRNLAHDTHHHTKPAHGRS